MHQDFLNWVSLNLVNKILSTLSGALGYLWLAHSPLWSSSCCMKRLNPWRTQDCNNTVAFVHPQTHLVSLQLLSLSWCTGTQVALGGPTAGGAEVTSGVDTYFSHAYLFCTPFLCYTSIITFPKSTQDPSPLAFFEKLNRNSKTTSFNKEWPVWQLPPCTYLPNIFFKSWNIIWVTNIPWDRPDTWFLPTPPKFPSGSQKHAVGKPVLFVFNVREPSKLKPCDQQITAVAGVTERPWMDSGCGAWGFSHGQPWSMKKASPTWCDIRASEECDSQDSERDSERKKGEDK